MFLIINKDNSPKSDQIIRVSRKLWSVVCYNNDSNSRRHLLFIPFIPMLLAFFIWVQLSIKLLMAVWFVLQDEWEDVYMCIFPVIADAGICRLCCKKQGS